MKTRVFARRSYFKAIVKSSFVAPKTWRLFVLSTIYIRVAKNVLRTFECQRQHFPLIILERCDNKSVDGELFADAKISWRSMTESRSLPQRRGKKRNRLARAGTRPWFLITANEIPQHTSVMFYLVFKLPLCCKWINSLEMLWFDSSTGNGSNSKASQCSYLKFRRKKEID